MAKSNPTKKELLEKLAKYETADNQTTDEQYNARMQRSIQNEPVLEQMYKLVSELHCDNSIKQGLREKLNAVDPTEPENKPTAEELLEKQYIEDSAGTGEVDTEHPERIRVVDVFANLYNNHQPVYDTLMNIAELLIRKSADYSGTGNIFNAFTGAAATAGTDVDSVYRTLIGIKSAREASIIKCGNEPKFESLQDTRIDRACYCILQCAYHCYMDYDPFNGE